MASDTKSPKRELTPGPAPASTIPQKRALEDDHAPAVSSPLNPDFRSAREESAAVRDRAARTKKESLKKREAKGPDSRATPPPREKKTPAPVAPLRYKLPPPKSTDFEAPRGPIFTPHHTIQGPDGNEVQFHETSDHVYNRKSFHYTHCIADPAFPCTLHYRQSETEPFTARLNYEDTSTHMYVDEDGKCVTTDKGFRMAKANVCARSGRWYYECKIISGIPKEGEVSRAGSTGGHVRIGWARREATVDAPVGFDAYSYALRDVLGQKVFMSRPKDFFPPGEDIREGDVIGMEITLPSVALHRKVVDGNYNPAVDLDDEDGLDTEAQNIVRDRVPIRFKAHLYFEQIEYHSTKELEDLMNPSPIAPPGAVPATEPSPTHPQPSLRTLPHSSIRVYKNGKPMGTPFTNLLAFLPPASKPLAQVGAREGLDDGMLGYYPAVSVFRGGAAELNFGPDFWYPPPDADDQAERASSSHQIRAIGERYREQIVEDILYDIIDEVDFWIQDGGVAGKGRRLGTLPTTTGTATENGAGVVAMEHTSGEIKELVQDDE